MADVLPGESGRAFGLLMARGGSKRVPGKNARLFAGKPMLVWPLSAMCESGLFERIIVSSDDGEILRLAVAEGAEAPFVRPPELADDHATTMDVVRHAAEFLAANGESFSSICCVYGTSAFLTPEHVRQSRRLLEDADMVMAAVRFGHPVQRGFTITDDTPVFPATMMSRTQDLAPYYHDAGLLYWVRRESILSGVLDDYSKARVKAFIVPYGTVCDIDDPEDWETAERLFAARRRLAGEGV